MRFHPSGHKTIYIALLLFAAASTGFLLLDMPILKSILLILSIVVLIFCLQFFRYPSRELSGAQAGEIYAPADGKVVVIEKVHEKKHFDEERTQVSIFMSPTNVHVNWTPCSGKVVKADLIDGQYLFAINPKSSELNEHSEIIIDHHGDHIYTKQIAGVMARRILCDIEAGQELNYSDEIGFIKFGSRMDLLLPLDYEVLVNIGDITAGNKTLVARKKA